MRLLLRVCLGNGRTGEWCARANEPNPLDNRAARATPRRHTEKVILTASPVTILKETYSQSKAVISLTSQSSAVAAYNHLIQMNNLLPIAFQNYGLGYLRLSSISDIVAQSFTATYTIRMTVYAMDAISDFPGKKDRTVSHLCQRGNGYFTKRGHNQIPLDEYHEHMVFKLRRTTGIAFLQNSFPATYTTCTAACTMDAVVGFPGKRVGTVSHLCQRGNGYFTKRGHNQILLGAHMVFKLK